jgi:hypothetical protein
VITGWRRAHQAESGANEATEIAGAFVGSELVLLNYVPHGWDDGHAQLGVAAISRLDVDVAARPESGFAAVLGSCVRASSSKTRWPALPPESNGKPTQLSLLTPDNGPEEIARLGSLGSFGSVLLLSPAQWKG